MPLYGIGRVSIHQLRCNWSRLSNPSAALLVLLPAATRAWVVAADGAGGRLGSGDIAARKDETGAVAARIRRGFRLLLFLFLLMALRRGFPTLQGHLGQELLKRGR
jgi:hypothetical protein